MDILQSCILTLIACIYTALHLDILSKPIWQRFLVEKGKWVVITLLAPEISLYTAASQLYYAWSLKSALRKIQKERQSSNRTADADFEITLKYAFFVVMGAVRFDVHEILSIEDLDEDIWKRYKDSNEHQRSVRPGPAAIISLAAKGHWVKIRTGEIDDKSKANTFQKGLVIIQVLWMVVQCATRAIFGLPLTLLEIHTMVHVICAFLLYACWFKKPLDIQEPTIIQPHSFISELSIMLQRQFYSGMSYKLAIFPEKQQSDQSPPTGAKGEPMRWIEPEPGTHEAGYTFFTMPHNFPWDLHRPFLRTDDTVSKMMGCDPFGFSKQRKRWPG
ncbi:hypothetical protein F25303_12080 [Fusarium sp. NRRL 25303]|nr:hypothetical protein F25303_12080 [Fusarium sp. NRRL 25303]